MLSLFGLTRDPRPDMAWPNPGPAPVWPPPAEEGWYQFEQSEYGRSVGARTVGRAVTFSGAPDRWGTGKLSEDSSGKATYSEGGSGGMEYRSKALGCFDVPAALLATLPLSGAAVVAVEDLYGNRLYARVEAAPAATDCCTGEPFRRVPIPTGRPESERAAWEREVAAWQAAYERAIRAAIENFAASEAGKQAVEEQAKRDAAAALEARHGAPAAAEWYLFGVEAANVLAAHPRLIPGMGVSPVPAVKGWDRFAVAGGLSLLAVEDDRGKPRKGDAYRIDWSESRGVHPIVSIDGKGRVSVVAAVEPGFRLVAKYHSRDSILESRVWDATGAREEFVPPAPGGLGTFADLLRK